MMPEDDINELCGEMNSALQDLADQPSDDEAYSRAVLKSLELDGLIDTLYRPEMI